MSTGVAVIDVAGFVAELKSHAVDHGFHVHDERHFASDVMAGATEGIIIGRSVTWHGRNFYASPMLGPKAAGVMVSTTSAAV